MVSPRTALLTIKTVHTIVWSIFVAAIVGVPIAARFGSWGVVAVLVAVVSAECVVLAANRMRCPLTAIAERYTDDRRANFDIWLPEWLARHNKAIFGTMFVLGLIYTASQLVGCFGEAASVMPSEYRSAAWTPNSSGASSSPCSSVP